MSGKYLTLTSLASLNVSQHHIPFFQHIPNSSAYPLLHYRGAYPPSTSASAVEAHLAALGAALPQWRYTMYRKCHFHSTAHEVLCVVQGQATLCFGGGENPARVELAARAGDVLIVPAGVAHHLLEEGKEGFEMVGSYPPGQQWDMCYGEDGEEQKVKGIEGVKWFDRDPLYGEKGPTVKVAHAEENGG